MQNPCQAANYSHVQDDPAPESISIQIGGSGPEVTSDGPFTNDVNEALFADMESEGYEWPICGYPTHHSLVDDNENELDFQCSRVEAEL